MLFRELKPILYAEDKDLFDKMFVNGQFSYNEPIMIDQISLYDGADSVAAKDDAERFGCRIDNNGDDVWIPAGLPFTIRKTNAPYAVMEISRNGVTYYPEYVEDTEVVNVEFTEFGQKLYDYAKASYTTVMAAYDQLLLIEKIFGSKIIAD
jgi:hypothetical protein